MRIPSPAPALLLPILAVVTLSAQPPAPPGGGAGAAPGKLTLTVDSIMRGPGLVGYPPSGLRWSGDSRDLFFEWRKPGEKDGATYVLSQHTTTPRRLTDEERKLAPPVGGAWDEARRRVVFADGGDIVVLDTVARTRQQVTRTTAPESGPRWARHDTAVTFVSQNNLFIIPLAGGSIEQLTDVKPRRRETRDTDSQKFVREQEAALLQATRDAVEQRKAGEETRKKDSLPEFEITERQSVAQFTLHPSERWVFLLVAERAEAKNAVVPNYVTESGYTEDIPSRSKVGDVQGRQRLAVLNLKTRTSVWADASFAGTAKVQGKDEPRDVRWSAPMVSPDGRLVVATARSADFKDRWIVALDPESGKARVIDALHDDAWIREGGGGPFGGGGMGWMPDGQSLWFLSERDGYMHLYVVDAAQPGAAPAQRTSGAFELTSAELARDKTKFYLVTSEVHPGERHIYEMPAGGGPRTRLTEMAGSNIGEVSPDGSMIAFIQSSAARPPEVFVMPNRAGAPVQQVTTSPTDAWRTFRWIEPEVITYKARDGKDVHARLYTPEMIGAARDRTRPAVIFVHGAGYLQNAHRFWSTYYREYMFHNLLASLGYVVLDADYRASAGYGRDWRTAIYRHMGGKDLDDIVDGAKYLVDRQRVDPKRIGVYGGSYGGFITLMALFTSPDTFAAGAALRPVTDWAHYNHGYSGSILNEPQDDPAAYKQSSPIYFADGLKGALLICHGLVDTNVHAQDSIRLAQRLIELRKTNWELAVYPVENHGFEQETSWADQYKRILRLFDTHLRLAPPSRAKAR
ncbi:MAG: prolyl oligopeptidase family serine peptidase [Vicinamibacterales bacterium]|jgi:dipeptidyl aminopeptidase/acylaminoacyl peptidase|nr:prolyl oligopeptidase family serine peptidase [Vicinamibacterales bacterium]